MATAIKRIDATYGGITYSNDQSEATPDLPVGPGLYTLEAGKTVTAWVKTSASVAACNLPSGHGYSNGNFDVYWVVAGVTYVRYGVPGTITTNALALSGGAGVDFPASATADVVVCKRTTIAIAFDGDNVKFIATQMSNTSDTDSYCHADFNDVSPASLIAMKIPHDKAALGFEYVRNVQQGETNYLLGMDVAFIYVSNGSPDASAVFRFYVGLDSTP